jgi:hypothetical protein
MKHKCAIYPLVMSICALLCFAAVALIFSGAVQPLWGKMAILSLPALVFGGIALLAATGKLGARATGIWTTVLAIVLFLASVFYVVLLFVWTATTTTTDAKYYSRAYEQIHEGNGVEAVFPKSIPGDAEDISFMYYPQFLQGGEVFELSYTTTHEKLAQWTTLLEQQAQWIGSNRQWHTQNNWNFDGVEAVRYQLYWDGGFNHGELCYVLIDEASGRITFYFTQW